MKMEQLLRDKRSLEGEVYQLKQVNKDLLKDKKDQEAKERHSYSRFEDSIKKI